MEEASTDKEPDNSSGNGGTSGPSPAASGSVAVAAPPGDAADAVGELPAKGPGEAAREGKVRLGVRLHPDLDSPGQVFYVMFPADTAFETAYRKHTRNL
jgi:hypothetical protein